MRCAICHEEILPTNMRTLACGHQFHPRCINRWLDIALTCPYCRNPMGVITQSASASLTASPPIAEDFYSHGAYGLIAPPVTNDNIVFKMTVFTNGKRSLDPSIPPLDGVAAITDYGDVETFNAGREALYDSEAPGPFGAVNSPVSEFLPFISRDGLTRLVLPRSRDDRSPIVNGYPLYALPVGEYEQSELGYTIIKYEESHACYLKPLRNYQFLREQQSYPLLVPNLPSLIPHYPFS